MQKRDSDVLLNFLKSGFSTRQLDKLLGNTNTKGWVSWDILKKYKLKNTDKGRLFLYSTGQSRQIILKLMKEKNADALDELIKIHRPSNLEKYKNTFVIAESEKSFYSIMSGETRNIIRDFFNPRKKLIGKCQFKNCMKNSIQLDTVHFERRRPDIFISCARINMQKQIDSSYKFDVYGTMNCFLENHSKPKSVCFLCKKHHNEFHKAEKISKAKLRAFKRKIIF